MKDDAMVSPLERGRQAFWSGKAIFSNPLVEHQAAEWRRGWLDAKDDFCIRGGRLDSSEDLDRLRPKGLPKMRPYRKMTHRGAATRALVKRRQGRGWGATS